MLNLVPSAARTASGTLGLTGGALGVPAILAPVRAPDNIRSAQFLLDVTAAATDVGDTLDVFLQSSLDGGVTWDDWIHFTQVLGNGGLKKFLAEWSRDQLPETEMHAPQDALLTAGVKQGPIGADWRAKWAIVDAGTVNASFTFGLSMLPFYR